MVEYVVVYNGFNLFVGDWCWCEFVWFCNCVFEGESCVVVFVVIVLGVYVLLNVWFDMFWFKVVCKCVEFGMLFIDNLILLFDELIVLMCDLYVVDDEVLLYMGILIECECVLLVVFIEMFEYGICGIIVLCVMMKEGVWLMVEVKECSDDDGLYCIVWLGVFECVFMFDIDVMWLC